jgi:hypothetical protein
VFSNHKSLSRDIASTFAGMARVKHIVSGGWWKSKDKNIQAGKGIQCHFLDNQALCHCLGLNSQLSDDPS